VLVIAVFAVISIVPFIAILAATLIVTIGVHKEERKLTFTCRRSPTAAAWLARVIIGHYVRKTRPDWNAQLRRERVPWFERKN
jgi:hypothetical protein